MVIEIKPVRKQLDKYCVLTMVSKTSNCTNMKHRNVLSVNSQSMPFIYF